MDNAAFHKKDEIIKIAEEFGHDVLFLPPYSPLNFGQVKSLGGNPQLQKTCVCN